MLKAACTDQAFHGASECLQVFGGHGYVREWGVEQVVRDSRVAMIYEGTNEIQAIDLLVRKVLPDGGAAFRAFLADLKPQGALLANRFDALGRSTSGIAAAARANAELPYWIAGDFLRAVALGLLAWGWERIGSATELAGERWSAPARALNAWVLPEFEMRLGIIEAEVVRAGGGLQRAVEHH